MAPVKGPTQTKNPLPEAMLSAPDSELYRYVQVVPLDDVHHWNIFEAPRTETSSPLPAAIWLPLTALPGRVLHVRPSGLCRPPANHFPNANTGAVYPQYEPAVQLTASVDTISLAPPGTKYFPLLKWMLSALNPVGRRLEVHARPSMDE